MPPPAWSFHATVRGRPDDVFAWMSDFREDDHARPAFLRGAGVKSGSKNTSIRKIVGRDGNVITVHDSWGPREFTLKVELVPDRRELILRGDYGYESTWRAVPDGDGTRVEVDGRIQPTGFFKLLIPLFAKGFQKDMEADFKGHIADLDESLAPSTVSAGHGA